MSILEIIAFAVNLSVVIAIIASCIEDWRYHRSAEYKRLMAYLYPKKITVDELAKHDPFSRALYKHTNRIKRY